MIHLTTWCLAAFDIKHSPPDQHKGSMIIVDTVKFKVENLVLQLLIKIM